MRSRTGIHVPSLSPRPFLIPRTLRNPSMLWKPAGQIYYRDWVICPSYQPIQRILSISRPPFFRMAARGGLYVVHAGAGPLGLAAGYVLDGGGAEGRAQRLHPLLPDPAGLLSLLADHPVQRLHDLEHVDLIGRPGQRVAALGAAMADQDPRPPQGRE